MSHPTKAREFKSLEVLAATVENLGSVEYIATIKGCSDEARVTTDGPDLKQELIERGFDADRDIVTVWLPLGHDMVTSS